jgi:peptidoglycan/LPS O-acetylase OafA/YrhL
MTKRIYAIDSLRAIAMTMVIAQHCKLLPFGWTGVWLFYVISGFVISRNFIAENATFKPAPRSHYLSFVTRRGFRIIPPYAAYIAICLLVIGLLGHPEPYRELPFLTTFTFNWRMIFSVEPQSSAFGHLWTISVEEQFYVLFPILILLLKRDRAIFGLFAICLLAPVSRNVMAEQMAAHGWDSERIAFGVYASSFGQFDAFALGALLSHFENAIRRYPQVATKMAWLALVMAMVYVATYIGINIKSGARGVDAIRNIVSGVLYGEKREVFVYIVIDFCAAAILAGAIAGWRVFNLIEHPALVAVGQVSYGGYLVHAIVLLVMGEAIGSLFESQTVEVRIVFFLVAWCCTVAIAWLSYITWERKLIRYGHKIAQRIMLRANGRPVGASV